VIVQQTVLNVIFIAVLIVLLTAMVRARGNTVNALNRVWVAVKSFALNAARNVLRVRT